MLSRKFTTREKVLLLIFAVLLLGILYYQFVWTETSNTIASNNTVELEDELMVEQAKAQNKKKMEEEIKSGKQEENGMIATYNNITNEMNELNAILASADTYTLNFSQAEAVGTTVRRNIQVSYHAGNYQLMKAILESLHGCKYRCLIRDLDISAGQTGDGSGSASLTTSSDLNVNLTITFYETTANAETTAGLKMEEGSAESPEDTADTENE